LSVISYWHKARLLIGIIYRNDITNQFELLISDSYLGWMSFKNAVSLADNRCRARSGSDTGAMRCSGDGRAAADGCLTVHDLRLLLCVAGCG
jgi:hypothetical protein